MVTGSGPQAAKWVPFTWVNTALGNIKTALAGTYHHVSAKHAQRYLASFAWRFNRRYHACYGRFPDPALLRNNPEHDTHCQAAFYCMRAV